MRVVQFWHVLYPGSTFLPGPGLGQGLGVTGNRSQLGLPVGSDSRRGRPKGLFSAGGFWERQGPGLS